jgi:predicted transcriptional regulator
MPTLSVKLDENSRDKLQALALEQGISTHAFMVQAIESAVARSEVDGALVARALLSRKNIEQTGMVVDGLAMSHYLKDKVRGHNSPRPSPQGIDQLFSKDR